MVYDGRNHFAGSGKKPPNVMDVMWIIIPSNDAKGISIVFMTMLQKYKFITAR